MTPAPRAHGASNAGIIRRPVVGRLRPAWFVFPGSTAPLQRRPLVLGCPNCGTLQRVASAAATGTAIDCILCRQTLDRRVARSRTAALACAAAGLLLLIPANLATFLTTSILGVSRRSVLSSTATTMFERGYADLGTVIWLLVVAFPFVRLALVTWVLGCLRLKRHPRGLGRAFRMANALEIWAMADVFLAGAVVAYQRLLATIPVEIGLGAYCFAGAALMSLFVRATLDKPAVWEAIAPQHTKDPPPPSAEPVVMCESCTLLCPAECENERCPRCTARLHRRRPHAVERAAALTLAGAILYIPANIYPIATLPVGLTSVRYNVIQGVLDLYESGLYGLAALVLTASFAIPLFKLAVIGWCVVSVLRRSEARLVAKTRAYRLVDEIGRWSMIDPFVIGTFVPVTQYNELVNGRVESAAPAFAAVVLLTMFATHAFDPRLLWDGKIPARPHD